MKIKRWWRRSLGLFLVLLFSVVLGCDDEEPGEKDLVGEEVEETSSEPEVEEVPYYPPVPIGANCESERDCPGGDGICAKALPNGYCTLVCEEASICPEGSTCSILNGYPFCFQTCEDDQGCRGEDGYSCIEGICQVGCESDDECDEWQSCTGRLCTDPPQDKESGEVCEWSLECLSNRCLSPSDGGVCASPCGEGERCEEGMICRPAKPQGFGSESLCVPAPDLGFETLMLEGAPPWSFTVPEGILSFLLVVPTNLNDYQGLHYLTGPGGQLYAGSGMETWMTAPLQMMANFALGAGLVPNNRDARVQAIPGEYTFETMWENRAQDVPPQVVMKTYQGGGPLVMVKIDFNFHLVDGLEEGLNAETAATHEEMQEVVEWIGKQYYTGVKLGLGEVNYYSIPESYTSIDSEYEMRELFAEYSRPGGVDIFFVREILRGQAAGIAGGIPGAGLIDGTGGSGVVVQWQTWGDGSLARKTTGDTLVHELGHYLGFFHVTEMDGSAHDPIRDTAECKVNPGDAWGYEECWENIMYPTLLTHFGINQGYSATQTWVIQQHPVSY